jgi:hypothetical protein
MTNKLPAAFGAVLAFTLAASSAQAEVRKLMKLGPGTLTPHFELVLTPPKDWIEEKEASKENGVQIMVPRGRHFGNAPALMYVKVSNRQDKQSLEDFVGNSQKRWREQVSDTKIEKLADVQRASGQPAFVSYRYENPSRPQQRFEAVSFGIDKDNDGNEFFVMVALTGRDKKAIDQGMTPYNAFLKTH